MAYLDLLVNLCTVRRYPAAGAQDAYGMPARVWADIHTNEPCRWSTPSNREVKVGAEVVLADLQLFLGDVSVTAQDRVVLNGLTYEILSASVRQDGVGSHHVECLLRTVK